LAHHALDMALGLDALRASGAVGPLTFAMQYRSVIVAQFAYPIRRLPLWIEHHLHTNPALGPVSTW
jgi:hypothetical protein